MNQYDGQQIKGLVAAVDMVYEALVKPFDCPVCVATFPHEAHCGLCESPVRLRKCDDCGMPFCSTPQATSDCFRWHECAQVDGPNSYDVTRG